MLKFQLNNNDEPTIEPETCGEGKNGIDCDPQWDSEQEIWYCTTCNKNI